MFLFQCMSTRKARISARLTFGESLHNKLGKRRLRSSLREQSNCALGPMHLVRRWTLADPAMLQSRQRKLVLRWLSSEKHLCEGGEKAGGGKGREGLWAGRPEVERRSVNQAGSLAPHHHSSAAQAQYRHSNLCQHFCLGQGTNIQPARLSQRSIGLGSKFILGELFTRVVVMDWHKARMSLGRA